MKRMVMGMMLCVFSVLTHATINGKDVQYKVGDQVFKGYIAYDDAVKGKRPGVLVVHEWWGHNEYARKRARMLAELGYTALALDMYGEGTQAHHPEDAGKLAGEVRNNMEKAKARFVAAEDFLKNQPTVDVRRLAAIGYCFGGTVVLQMARSGLDLKGVASFHGSLSTSSPAIRDTVKAKVLVANGAADPSINLDEITVFKKEMDSAGVD